MDLSRRGFLTALSTAAITAASPNALAQQQDFVYQPDAQIMLGSRAVPVDLALLGPNGEETVGFYASLDPFHGRPFTPVWGTIYNHYVGNNPRNTDPSLIDYVLTHLEAHGLRRADLQGVYRSAYQAWQNRAELRVNHSP
jgi:hypothetical protein